MAGFPSSAHALKRVVAGLGSELAQTLSLNTAAGDVQASRRKHATHKPAPVQNSVPNLCYYLSFSYFVSIVFVCFEGSLVGLINNMIVMRY